MAYSQYLRVCRVRVVSHPNVELPVRFKMIYKIP